MMALAASSPEKLHVRVPSVATVSWQDVMVTQISNGRASMAFVFMVFGSSANLRRGQCRRRCRVSRGAFRRELGCVEEARRIGGG